MPTNNCLQEEQTCAIFLEGDPTPDTLKEIIFMEFLRDPAIERLKQMREMDIDEPDLERRNRFPFHSLDHLTSVANHASQIALNLYFTNSEFRKAAAGMLEIGSLSNDEQLRAVEIAYYISGLYHDIGNYYQDNGELIDMFRDPLNRERHEERSIGILSRIIGDNTSKISHVLNILKLDKDKFLNTAVLLIGATEVDFKAFSPALFGCEHLRELCTHPRYDNYFRFNALLYAPMFFADLPFAPLSVVWGDLRKEIVEIAKRNDVSINDTFKKVYELTLLVNHILFLFEGSNHPYRIDKNISLNSISQLMENVVKYAGHFLRPVSLIGVGNVRPDAISISTAKEYIEELLNTNLFKDILNLPHWSPAQRQGLIAIHHARC